MRKMVDIQCQGCGEIEIDRYVDIATVPAHECGGGWVVVHLQGAAHGVIGDDIPGGLEIKNLLVGPNGEPTTFYSKSGIRRAAAEKGYTWGAVDHVPDKGSDKSKHTTRWV